MAENDGSTARISLRPWAQKRNGAKFVLKGAHAALVRVRRDVDVLTPGELIRLETIVDDLRWFLLRWDEGNERSRTFWASRQKGEIA